MIMKKFLTDAFDEEKANVIAFGVKIGKNSSETLNSLRNTSWFVEFIDADSKLNLLENSRIFDSGDVGRDSLKEITEKVRQIRNNKKIPLVLSIAHVSTLFALRGLDKDFKLVVFDAHSDLHDKYMDEKVRNVNSHEGNGISEAVNDATWLRRFCDEFGKENVMLVGLRSDTEDVMSYLENFNYFTSTYVKNNLEDVKRKISEFSKDSNVYVSIDMDVFDPAVAPAVEYPEPDGLLFNHFKELISSVKGNLVGIDIVCFSYPNTVTEFLSCKSIFYTLDLLNK